MLGGVLQLVAGSVTFKLWLPKSLSAKSSHPPLQSKCIVENAKFDSGEAVKGGGFVDSQVVNTLGKARQCL